MKHMRRFTSVLICNIRSFMVKQKEKISMAYIKRQKLDNFDLYFELTGDK